MTPKVTRYSMLGYLFVKAIILDTSVKLWNKRFNVLAHRII